MTVRHLTFGSRTADNTSTNKLGDELRTLPELQPWRDGNGNAQASFTLGFNDAGELKIDLPAEKPTQAIIDVVNAHDPAPPADFDRAERMRQKVNQYILLAGAMADKIRANEATAAEQRAALAAVLEATARLARLQLRELDEEL